MTPWTTIILVMAAFRITRLIGWDDMPAILQARNRLIRWKDGQVGRPLLWHFLTCGFCLGFWVSLAVYGCWLLEPSWTVWVCLPLAISGAVGLVAKNLDA